MITEGLAEKSGKIPPRFGQQQLQWSELSLSGPSVFNGKLPEPLNIVERGSGKPGGQSFISADRPVKPGPDMHDITVLAVPDKPAFLSSELIRLKVLPNADGQLQWTVPAGEWKLLRFACAPTGRTNAWGLFTDGMSDEALDATWDVTLAQVLKGMTPAQRRGLYGIEDDSWEAGQSTWTKLFAEEFQQLRGYDLIPWLPAVAGLKIGTAAEREGVQRDYDRIVADLIAKHHYAHLD